METGRFLSGCFLVVAVLAAAPATAQTVVVSDAAELIDALEGDASIIEVDGAIELGRYQSSGNALPTIGEPSTLNEITKSVTIRGREGAELRAADSGFRLAEVLDGGRLVLSDIAVLGFDSPEPGGALMVADGLIVVERTLFEGNRSGDNGGAIAAG